MQTITKCEHCHVADAVQTVQGEADSFGQETLSLCASCAAAAQKASAEYYAASDVTDRAPKPGHRFLVNECTNDDRTSWFRSFTSYREAKGYYRMVKNAAGTHGGLYNASGVQELPESEVAQRVAVRQRELEAEMAMLDELEAENATWSDGYADAAWDDE